MTLIVSMCTKNGIFMIADSLIIDDYGRRYEPTSYIEKIIIFEDNNIALSFWGTIKNGATNFDMQSELIEFKKKVSKEDNIFTISEKLKSHLEALKPLDSEDELGFHLAGYYDDKPILKHLFHTLWLKQNQFIDETSNYEYYQPLSNDKNTIIIGFKRIKREQQFPMLFNGENSIPNLIVNGILAYKDSIKYEDFDKEEAKKFMLLIMNTAIRLQDFRKHFKDNGKLMDYPLTFCGVYRDKVDIEYINKKGEEKKTLQEALQNDR